MHFKAFPKLLSHRARGFGHTESSYAAIKSAIQSGVPYLELDTRVNSEGHIYCYHHARLKTGSKLFNCSNEKLIHSKLARLEDILELAKEHIQPFQKLCIDIKDYGYEQLHLDLVKSYALISQTVFISWIPQTLLVLHQLSPDSPKILSHINLTFSPGLTSFSKILFGNRETRLLDFVLMGKKWTYGELKHRLGYQHALFVDKLPDDIVNTLRASGGGICVPRFSLCQQLDEYCRENHLQQWVFTANTLDTFEKLNNNPSIDVIFTDKPYQMINTP